MKSLFLLFTFMFICLTFSFSQSPAELNAMQQLLLEELKIDQELSLNKLKLVKLDGDYDSLVQVWVNEELQWRKSCKKHEKDLDLLYADADLVLWYLAMRQWYLALLPLQEKWIVEHYIILKPLLNTLSGVKRGMEEARLQTLKKYQKYFFLMVRRFLAEQIKLDKTNVTAKYRMAMIEKYGSLFRKKSVRYMTLKYNWIERFQSSQGRPHMDKWMNKRGELWDFYCVRMYIIIAYILQNEKNLVPYSEPSVLKEKADDAKREKIIDILR